MRRHAQAAQPQQGMRAVVEPVQEQATSARRTRGQADVVQHQQRPCAPAGRARRLGERHEGDAGGRSQPAMSIQLQGHGNSMLGECVSPAAIMPSLEHAQDSGPDAADPKARNRQAEHRRSLPPAGGVRWFVGYLPAGRSVHAWSALHQVRPFCNALPSGADGCRSARSHHVCAAAGLGGRLGRRGRARRARHLRAAMRATHSTAMMMTIQNSSLPTFNPMQNHFQHEPAAGVGQDQETEAGQRPAQRHPPRQPQTWRPRQRRRRSPGQQREDGLVVEGQDLAGELERGDRAGRPPATARRSRSDDLNSRCSCTSSGG